MAVRLGSPVAYGPPAGVLSVIHGFRDRGLTTPFTADVLLRAGISESLVPRVYKALEGLDLIDADGNPTPQLIGLRQAKTDEFQAALAEVVRAAYAEVLQFVNPATDDLTRITDAFRSYEPAGQRTRMVTLFMGLCEAAGMTPPSDKKARASATPSVAKKKKAASQPPYRESPGMAARGSKKFGQMESLPPETPGMRVIYASIASIPAEGWTKAQRDKFMTFFAAAVDFEIPILEERTASVHTDDVGDEDADE